MLEARKVGTSTLEICVGGELEGDEAAKILIDHLEKAIEERRHVLLNLQDCEGIGADVISLLLEMEGRFHEDGALDLLPFGASNEVRQLLQASAEL